MLLLLVLLLLVALLLTPLLAGCGVCASTGVANKPSATIPAPSVRIDIGFTLFVVTAPGKRC